MKVLLFAILAAISYAQTECETENGYREIIMAGFRFQSEESPVKLGDTVNPEECKSMCDADVACFGFYFHEGRAECKGYVYGVHIRENLLENAAEEADINAGRTMFKCITCDETHFGYQEELEAGKWWSPDGNVDVIAGVSTYTLDSCRQRCDENQGCLGFYLGKFGFGPNGCFHYETYRNGEVKDTPDEGFAESVTPSYMKYTECAPVDCVLDEAASADTCTSSCGNVPGVGFPEAANGGQACPEYTCKPGDGTCTAISATSHGDPIVWTFKNECYDLNIDGLYVAISHKNWWHTVKVAVYNDFFREIQIVDERNGHIYVAIDNLGDLMIDQWPYPVKTTTRECSKTFDKECVINFKQFEFDALIFRFTVQIKMHDYLDPALSEGESGMHLDIFPELYTKHTLKVDEYEGVYFDNPLPEKLEYCPEGSPRRKNKDF